MRMMTEWEPEKVDFEPDDFDDDGRSEEIFEILINTGALEIMGYDHQGDPVFRFTEKCKDVFPELYAMHQSEVNNTANELWQLGLISLNFTDEDMTVTITPDNYSNLKNYEGDLTEEHLNFLQSLVVRRNMDDD